MYLRSLPENVLVESDDHSAGIRVVTRWGEFVFDDLAPAVRAAVERMSLGPMAVDNISPSGQRESEQLAAVLATLSGSVVHTLDLGDGQGAVLSAIPMAEEARFALAELDHHAPVRLSRFAAVRTCGRGMVVESPLAGYRVMLHRQLAYRVVAALGNVVSVAELADTLRMAPPVMADIVGYLIAAGVVCQGTWGAGERSRRNGVWFAEDHDPVLARWTHHDLMFHSYSRMGRHGGPSGAVFPHADSGPPPVVKPMPEGKRFPLYRPDDTTPSLTQLIEADQVCPPVSDRPLTAERLGALLYQAARVRSVSAWPGTGVRYEVSDRPYLSVAGLYELELYLSLYRCTGLPRGIYHYDPAGHALTLINDTAADLTRMLDNAKVAAGQHTRPSVLISVTARAERLSWMFSGVGYATALMHLGALQQVLYLVATAAGMASCALVLDTSDVTDRALRLDWPAEIGVGECIIGHRD